MTEPTEAPPGVPNEHPYRGMSEGYAGEWGSAVGPVADGPGGVPTRPTPPVPPPAPQVNTGPAREPDPGDETGTAVGDKLSALLQSAVDEQVQEQRQLVQLMAEIQAGLARRSAESADDLRSVVENAVGGAVSQLTDQFRAGMQTLREQHDAQIAELSQRLAEAQSELHGLRELASEPAGEPYRDGPSVGDLVDGLAGMRTELRTLPEQMAPFVASALGPSVAELGRTLSALEDVQQATSHDTARVHAALAAVLPRLEGVPEQINVLGGQIASLRAAQAELAQTPRVAAGPDAHEIADIVRKGVRDATRDFVRDYLRDAVRDIVTVSTRDTERRITDHVDEAVLALAQALLTRRPALAPPREYVAVTPTTAAPASPPPEPPASPPSAAAPASPPPEPPAASQPQPSQPQSSAEAAEAGVTSAPLLTPEFSLAEPPAAEASGPAPATGGSASEDPEPVTSSPVEAVAADASPPQTHRRRGLFRRR